MSGVLKKIIFGKAGKIETECCFPSSPPRGVVFLTHPHPLFGGSFNNKVVFILQNAFLERGFIAAKFNFRGVGQSEGEFDDGQGETEDLITVMDKLLTEELSSFLKEGFQVGAAGFSFGTYVICRAALKKKFDFSFLIGTAPQKWAYPSPPPNSYIFHGERDEVSPLSSVLDWLRIGRHPLIVIPGASHFFDKSLTSLKQALLSIGIPVKK